MPLYEFECLKCRHRFEHLARSADDTATPACPGCGGRKVERLPSVFAARQGQATAGEPPPRCEGCSQGTGGACPFSR